MRATTGLIKSRPVGRLLGRDCWLETVAACSMEETGERADEEIDEGVDERVDEAMDGALAGSAGVASA